MQRKQPADFGRTYVVVKLNNTAGMRECLPWSKVFAQTSQVEVADEEFALKWWRVCVMIEEREIGRKEVICIYSGVIIHATCLLLHLNCCRYYTRISMHETIGSVLVRGWITPKSNTAKVNIYKTFFAVSAYINKYMYIVNVYKQT